jgi:hypothetical protein
MDGLETAAGMDGFSVAYSRMRKTSLAERKGGRDAGTEELLVAFDVTPNPGRSPTNDLLLPGADFVLLVRIDDAELLVQEYYDTKLSINAWTVPPRPCDAERRIIRSSSRHNGQATAANLSDADEKRSRRCPHGGDGPARLRNGNPSS